MAKEKDQEREVLHKDLDDAIKELDETGEQFEDFDGDLEEAHEEFHKAKEKSKSNQNEEEPLISMNLSRLSPMGLFRSYSNLSPRKKFVYTIFIGLFGFLVLGIFFAIAFRLDSYIFPSTLRGSIVQRDFEPVEGAKVCIGNKCDTTNSEGNYRLEGLAYGSRKVTVEAEGYSKIEEIINVKRGLNSQNFELKIAGQKDIYGKFTSDEEIIKEDFKLYSADQVFDITIKDSGSFTTGDIDIPSSVIEVYSPNYKNVQFNIEAGQDSVNLGEIKLEPAGDIVFKPIDWLSLENLSEVSAKTKATKDNPAVDTQLRKLDESTYAIEDLDIGASAQFVAMAGGYNDKNIKVSSIAQGNNELKDFGMVREGKVLYVSDRTGNRNIYMANYDGSSEERITDDKASIDDVYYSKEDNKATFVSNRGDVKDSYGNTVSAIYEIDLTSRALKKISTEPLFPEGTYEGIYNYMAGKKLYKREHPDYPNTYQYFYGNASSVNLPQIIHTADYLDRFVLSDDGIHVMYDGYYSDKTKNGVQLLNVNSGKTDRIFDSFGNEYAYAVEISPDGTKGLLDKRYQDKPSSSDIVIRDFNQGKLISLTTDAIREFATGFNEDGSKVSFLSTRDNKTDLYVISLDDNKQTRLTKNSQISNYEWQNGLIFFSSEGNLFVVDPEKPEKSRLVTEQGGIQYMYNAKYSYYGGYD